MLLGNGSARTATVDISAMRNLGACRTWLHACDGLLGPKSQQMLLVAGISTVATATPAQLTRQAR